MHGLIATITCVCTFAHSVSSQCMLTTDCRDGGTHTQAQAASYKQQICMGVQKEDGQPTARTLDRRVEVNREACLMTT
jgi:hypothetical protein